MTHPSAPKPKPNRDNTRWTADKATIFLKALARTGKVGQCARAVGMSRQSAYRLRARAPEFALCWDIAMQEAMRRRATARASRRRKPVHPLLARHRAPAPEFEPECRFDPGDTLGPIG